MLDAQELQLKRQANPTVSTYLSLLWFLVSSSGPGGWVLAGVRAMSCSTGWWESWQSPGALAAVVFICTGQAQDSVPPPLAGTGDESGTQSST